MRAAATGLLVALLAACGPAPAGDAPAAPDATPRDPATAPLAEVFAEARLLQWKLPKRLREISGLALDPDGRLFAIADERAEVVELDYREGAVIRRFDVGDPVLEGDFEGLAAPGDDLYAITSDGVLVRFPAGADAASVPHERFETGLAGRCEVEGLASERDRGTLLVACKHVRVHGERGQVWLQRWNIAARALEAEPIAFDEDQLAEAVGDDEFAPSGVALTPDGSHVLVVAARQQAVARFRRAADGGLEFEDAIRLPARDRHRQTEGVAVLASGAVVLADEGGDKRGRLGLYGQP